jgi:hypothetical protein
MPEQLGRIDIPELVATEVWPLALKPDYPHGRAIAPAVAIHRFGSGDTQIEQRYLLGDGAIRFNIVKRHLTNADREALMEFWGAIGGPSGVFFYDAPDDQAGTATRYTVRFDDASLPVEMLGAAVASVGVTLVEVGTDTPEYTISSTVTRFPSADLKTALLAQVQRIIPLVKIQPLESEYPTIYVSDRRCKVGGQLYQARLLRWEGISQGMEGQPDDAQFVFGNADRVMRALANDTDLVRASVEFSLYHVGSGIKCDLWKGHVTGWALDEGPEFGLSASDGIYEMGLSYPGRKCSHTCAWSFDDGENCPYTAEGSGGDPASCDKSLTGANGCASHGMRLHFGGVNAPTTSVRIKDNSTGTWGYRRSSITSVSLQAETIADQVLPEIYTDSAMPVNCKLVSGREESDFYDALGVVGEGPLGGLSAGAMIDDTYQGPTLDGQPHHGFGTQNPTYGLRQVLGTNPAVAGEEFVLSTGQPGEVLDSVYAAATAWQEVRRVDAKGFQPSALAEHSMQAVVTAGLKGWTWTDSGDHEIFNRSVAKVTLTNPIWIAVNMVLRARGVFNADAATQLQFFDVKACADATLEGEIPKGAALICDLLVAPIWTKYQRIWTPEEGHWDEGTGEWVIDVEGHWDQVEVETERQFKFRGVLQEEKPLRDWLAEVLANCLGYYTFAFGKFKPGIRINSSVVEAFTIGNILFESLKLGPARAGFNDLSASFADEEYAFALRTMPLYDQDHATLLGGGSGAVRLRSQINLVGTFSKSQAARIITARLREEVGGISAAEWRASRQLGFRTTALALNVEPGMVCSLTHDDMPGGAGKFRVWSWRLNPDYSIEVEAKTNTDSMYNYAIGPKPGDVLPDPLPDNPYAEPAPNVLLFRAGTSNGDGTFTSAMYWDQTRQNMLIDWGCMLPIDRLNWSGVQIWLKRPDGIGGITYTPLTEIQKLEQFAEDTEGTRYRYDTIAVALASVPIPVESWVFIAASYDRQGVMRQTPTGIPLGPKVTLATLDKSDYAENFAAEIVTINVNNLPTHWGIHSTWTNPAIPRYVRTQIWLLNYGTAGNEQPMSGENVLTELESLNLSWPWPETPQAVRVVIRSIFGNDSKAPLTSCPYVDLVIERKLGTTGQEYCGLVSNITLTPVGSDGYGINGAGQRTFRAVIGWTPPSNDTHYAGGAVVIIRDGVHIGLGGLSGGFDFNHFDLETTHWPVTPEDVIFYVLSVDTLNHPNTYVEAVTPHLDYHWDPPTLGSAGSEYTSQVTGFDVTVSYPAQADGSYKPVLSIAFTKPSVATWGALSIQYSTDSGATWKEWTRGAISPIEYTMPVGIVATTYKVGGFGVDTNNHVNVYQSGVTPTEDIIVGNVAGQLDLRKFLGASVAATFASIGGVFDVNTSGITEIKVNAGAITETKIGTGAISTPKIQALAISSDLIAANAVIAGKIAANAVTANEIYAGSVSSAKLDATVINVGGGGSKPGKFAVYNASGVQIGFIGVEDGYSGAWFKSLGIGGTSKAAPQITADSSGNVSLSGNLLTTGTVGSAALDTTQINVGGGGSKPGKFAVYNASGVQIGFIGVEGGYEGAWFKQLGIGGSSAAAPKITADSSGNVSITGSTFVLTANGLTTKISNESVGGYPVGLNIAHDSSGNKLYAGYVSGSSYPWIYLFKVNKGSVTVTLNGDAGYIELTDILGSSALTMDASYYTSGAWRAHMVIGSVNATRELQVASIKVVGAQGAAVANPTVAVPAGSGSAVASAFAGDAYNCVAEIKGKLEDLLSRVRAHGLIAT